VYRDVTWKPYPWQTRVIEALAYARYINLVCANRIGKSYLLRRILYTYTAKYGNADNCSIYVGQDFKALNRNIIRKLKREWGAYVVNYDKNEHVMELVNGHLIYFVSAENLGSLEGLSDALVVMIDEASLCDEEVLDAADTRAIDLRAPILTASTAKAGPGVVWLKEQYEKGLNPEFCGADVDYFERYASFTATMYDASTRIGGHLSDKEINNFMARRSQKEIAVRVMGGFAEIGDLVFDATMLTPKKCGYRLESIAEIDMNNYMLVDTASGQTENEAGDDTAIVIVGIAPEYGIYVHECLADRYSVEDMQKIIISKCRQYGIRKVGIEHVAAQIHFALDSFRKAQRVDDAIRFIPLKRVGGKDKKRSRHERLLPYVESGRLFMPIDEYGNWLNGCTKLIAQMKNTPYGRHDDCIDALADVANPDMGIISGLETEPKVEKKFDPYFSPLMTQEEIDSIMEGGERHMSLRMN